MTTITTKHPILKVFSHLPNTNLFTTQTKQYVLLDTITTRKTTMLTNYTNNSPTLIKHKISTNHIIILTTTINQN